MTEAFHRDCMATMAQMKDNKFDLAIVDPPYGMGDRLIKGGLKGGMGSLGKLTDDKIMKWDYKPTSKYFEELERISINQIVWGGNYFLDYLGSNDGLIIWDKMNGTNALADAEVAWKSLKGTTRIFRMHHFSAGYESKTHPTQKPIALYKWLLKNYAKEGDRILDTHLGSGSSRIAAYDMGFDFVGYEIDKDYFNAQEKRFQNHIQQQSLFKPNEMYHG